MLDIQNKKSIIPNSIENIDTKVTHSLLKMGGGLSCEFSSLTNFGGINA